ncbi:hypothetical protein [Variovorax fucosicus]|nr:hypothetical protein [Variovorax sp. J22G21]
MTGGRRPAADTPDINIFAMPRPLSADREREFQELFALVDFWATHVKKTAPNSQNNMADVCANIVQQHGRSKALEGLRMAANDIIEELSDIPSEEVASLDESMLASGLVTLSELRRRYASSYKRIVKRGHIRNDTEYYLINGIVVDLAKAVPDAERRELQRLTEAYEAMARRP